MSTASQSAGPDTGHLIVVLMGYMGSGKTTTARALAELLGWKFVDLDEQIERDEHAPIRQLFCERGETAFRSIEHDALRRCIAQTSGATVLALGGGAYVQTENAELLRAGGARTVFLETPIEEMLTRCGIDDVPDPENPRPLAADTAAFRKLYEQRLPSYRAAELTVLTTGKTAEAIARGIAEKLGFIAER